MVSADGTFAATFPCKASDIYVQRERSAPLMLCISNDMVFGAGRGVSKIMPGNASFEMNFDSFLETVRNAFGASNVKELVISGHRAFECLCENSDGQPCKVVIEMPSGPPIMLTGGDNPASTATPEVWHRGSPRVEAFFSSLEILAK